MGRFNKNSEKTILKYSVNEKSIGRLEWNDPESDFNVLSSRALKELKELLPKLEVDSLKVLVLIFKNLAGADIRELMDISSKEALARRLDEIHEIFNRFESLKATKIAVLKGMCLGGGLELALTCDYRLAGDSSETRFGLPEVRLGFVPGLGGCFRLPRLVGLKMGLEMILSGKAFPPKFALDMGLVDEVTPSALLEKRVEVLAYQMIRGEKAPHPSQKFKPKGGKNILMESFLLRPFVFLQSKRYLLKKTKNFYPAPLRAWQVVKQTYLRASLPEALSREKAAFLEVAFTPESRNLIRLFFLKSQAKQQRSPLIETESLLNPSGRKFKSLPALPSGGKQNSLEGGNFQKKPQNANQTDRSLEKQGVNERNDPSLFFSCQVGVLGAGVMGSGIARLLADKGHKVRLMDVKEEMLIQAFNQANRFWKEQFTHGKIKKWEWQNKEDRLSLTGDLSGFSQMDIIIEALPEDKALKKQVLKEIGSYLTPNQIVASNTSSLSIGDLASACSWPEHVVGMHFFNPVHKMPLVEIVKTDQSDSAAVIRVFHLAKQLGKVPVIVRDRPGFIVNRLLMPYLSEALHLLMEGYNIKEVDHCYTHEFGFPMGPFRLMDEVGLGLCLKVIESFEATGISVFLPARAERVLRDLGPGRKQGLGFYRYEKRSVKVSKGALRFQKPGLEANSMECIHRGLYRLINEALRIREEDVAREEDIDLAGVLGMGFPPSLGGPLKYARDKGFSVIEQGLRDFSRRLGPRFVPDPALFR